MKAFGLIEFLVIVSILVIVTVLILLANRSPVDSHGGLQEDTYTAVIEGCQYIVVQGGIGDSKYFSMTHKGNCTNH